MGAAEFPDEKATCRICWEHANVKSEMLSPCKCSGEQAEGATAPARLASFPLLHSRSREQGGVRRPGGPGGLKQRWRYACRLRPPSACLQQLWSSAAH